MTASGGYAENLLLLIFNATPYANIADNAASSPLTNLYVSLHTASPTASGDQTSNESTYTSYARVAVARTSGGWTITDNAVSPVSNITFPTATGGTETVTHFGIGTASSGTGALLYFGTLSPNISVSSGVTPQITTASTITEV